MRMSPLSSISDEPVNGQALGFKVAARLTKSKPYLGMDVTRMTRGCFMCGLHLYVDKIRIGWLNTPKRPQRYVHRRHFTAVR